MAVIRPPENNNSRTKEHPTTTASSLLFRFLQLYRTHRHRILPILGLLYVSIRLGQFHSNAFYSTSLFSFSSSSSSNEGGTMISCPQYTFPKRTTQPQEEDQHQESLFLAKSLQTQRWVKTQSLTFLEEAGLQLHQQLLNQIEVQGIPGMIVECGVAKAGSAITFAAIKHPQRCLHLFDTFEGIPEPSAKDGEDVQQRYRKIQLDKQNCQQGLATCHKDYYGNMDDLLAFDQRQFELAGYPPSGNEVFFHKGLFDDTVWPAGPIAYAHLDGDWYDSTYHMLARISPFLSEGGYFVLDDVYQWSGAKNAYIDYFQVDLTWLQELQQPQPQQEGGSNTSKKPSSCWTMVETKETRVAQQRYYHLVLDVRATAQAISSKRAKELAKTEEVPRCVAPLASGGSATATATATTQSSKAT